jgi:hypothetical protein
MAGESNETLLTDQNSAASADAAQAAADKAAADKAAADAAASQTPEQKAAAEKAAADKAAADKAAGAPEKYESFKMPEGVELDKELGEGLSAVAKELNLTQAQAQKVADLGAQLQQRSAKAQQDNLVATVQQWAKDARADKELGGGEGFDANLAVAQRGIKEIFSAEGLKLLRESGLGNHPEFIRAGFKAGQLFKNDKTENGTTVPAKQNAQSFYSNSKMAP